MQECVVMWEGRHCRMFLSIILIEWRSLYLRHLPAAHCTLHCTATPNLILWPGGICQKFYKKKTFSQKFKHNLKWPWIDVDISIANVQTSQSSRCADCIFCIVTKCLCANSSLFVNGAWRLDTSRRKIFIFFKWSEKYYWHLYNNAI